MKSSVKTTMARMMERKKAGMGRRQGEEEGRKGEMAGIEDKEERGRRQGDKKGREIKNTGRGRWQEEKEGRVRKMAGK